MTASLGIPGSAGEQAQACRAAAYGSDLVPLLLRHTVRTILPQA